MIRNTNVDDTTNALPFAKHVLQDSAFTHLGLFEGIGGFSLAAEWMGWETLAWCEWNEFGQKVLRYHFPNAEGFGDIIKTDFTQYANRIDILTGGFPCQPYSVAGKRKGKEDERHLWPEMLRAIREIEPTYVVGENVSGIVNWDGGLVFNEVQADLEHQGYEVQPFILPACAKDAPHRRDRVWFIAYSDSRRNKRLQYELGKPKEIRQGRQDNEKNCNENATNSLCIGQQGQRRPEGQSNTTKVGNRKEYRAFNDGGWPIESAVRRANDGIPIQLDGITFSGWAKESIKAYGNAIVPQVVYEIFKAVWSVHRHFL
jgi:DNA (cytosine-5)-methyltransferase 1